jgi:protein-S-isoprenylcysteine O-methyltransferase Ste14
MADTSEPGRRMLPPAYFLMALILMACLHRLAPVRRIIPPPYRYLGFVLLAAGLALVLRAAILFKRAGTTIKPFERSSTLVVQGPYRFTRNPIYLGMVTGLAGAGIVAGSISPFFVVPAFALLIDRVFIRAEERMLAQVFGGAFEEYKRRVGRWL